MEHQEFDTIEEAKQAADEYGGNWRAVFIKQNGNTAFVASLNVRLIQWRLSNGAKQSYLNIFMVIH